MTRDEVPWFRDRAMWLAVLVAALVLIPRGILMQQRLSRCMDDHYHLGRGLLLLQREFGAMQLTSYNDPPLGEAIVALPIWMQGIDVIKPADGLDFNPHLTRHGKIISESRDQQLRIEISVWKALLALPMVAVMFAWVRSLYSTASAWLALGMLLADATFAAHLPLPTLDVLAITGIVIAARLIWSFANRPTLRNALATAVAIAVSISLKHTALSLLPLLAAACAVCWIGHDRFRACAEAWRRVLLLALVFLAIPLLIWPLTFFDDSRIQVPGAWKNDPAYAASLVFHCHIPGGVYWSSFLEGVTHDHNGHPALLLGQRSLGHWRSYFFIVAAYKIPLGIAAILLLGLLSLLWRPMRFDEWSLALPALVMTAVAVKTNIDIGFRHFLPAYFFLLMLASRCAAGKFEPQLNTDEHRLKMQEWNAQTRRREGNTGGEKDSSLHSYLRGFAPSRSSQSVFICVHLWLIPLLAWLCLAAAAIHVASFFPDFLSYLNYPRPFAYAEINDSNLDWGQSLFEIRDWLRAHRQANQPVYVGFFGPGDENRFEALDFVPDAISNHRRFVRAPGKPIPDMRWLPSHGILIVSPVLLGGMYDWQHRFDFLWLVPPETTIGHCDLVFDLDQLRRQGLIPPLAASLH